MVSSHVISHFLLETVSEILSELWPIEPRAFRFIKLEQPNQNEIHNLVEYVDCYDLVPSRQPPANCLCLSLSYTFPLCDRAIMVE